MATRNRPVRLDNVQALRALAAMLVVMVHAYGLGTKAGQDYGFLAGVDPWGIAGVDLFFVISGFIMVHIQEARPRGPGRFLTDRASRIAPLYWAITALFALRLAAGAGMPETAGPGQPWTSFLFLSQPLSGARPIVFLGWTLEYEAFFYLCFAVAIVAARRWRVDLLLPLGALVLGAVALAGVKPIAIEFLYGALLARGLSRTVPGARTGALLLGGGTALLLASFGHPEAVAIRPITFGLPATMIVAGAVILPQRAGAIAVALGDASYSLYLVHLFALSFAFSFLPTGAPLASFVVALGFAQIVALATHRFVERPLTRAASRWTRARRGGAIPTA